MENYWKGISFVHTDFKEFLVVLETNFLGLAVLILAHAGVLHFVPFFLTTL